MQSDRHTSPSGDVSSISDTDVRYAEYERHTTSDGIELAFRAQGSGPALVVVSSVLETSTAWRAFSRRSARRHRVVIYDLRGLGRSSAGAPSYGNHVADLSSLLAALEIERAVVMGHSVSTQICVQFALAHPDQVEGLILIGPMVNPGGSERRRRLIQGWANVLESSGVPALFDVFWPQILCDATFQRGGPEAYEAYRELWVADTSPERVAAQIRAAELAQARPTALDEIACPTLLVAGEDDFVGTESAVRETAEGIADCEVARLAGVGHVPHLEAPLSLHQAIDRFLARVQPGPLAPAASPTPAAS